ncbi:hypothetical protein CDAR_307951 [Caerostris darwini]|uniref:Uncharacterized protein n=1 Tax=Caerostris darwini TaxID=1538125 RepID=A0AAV4P594_9ARAC|nr:hypothetical protein CDAR_307951 [Caerostris darwini]
MGQPPQKGCSDDPSAPDFDSAWYGGPDSFTIPPPHANSDGIQVCCTWAAIKAYLADGLSIVAVGIHLEMEKFQLSDVVEKVFSTGIRPFLACTYTVMGQFIDCRLPHPSLPSCLDFIASS